MLIEQSRIEVTLFRRAGLVWEKTVFTQREDVLQFPSIDFAIPLSRVYDDVAV